VGNSRNPTFPESAWLLKSKPCKLWSDGRLARPARMRRPCLHYSREAVAKPGAIVAVGK